MGRVRRRLPRSRPALHRRLLADPAALRRWLLVAVLAATTAVATGATLSAAEAERARWGTTRPVLVAGEAIEAGDRVAGSVDLADWPEALVPAGALGTVPEGARAAGPIGTGTPLTEAAVVGGDGALGPGGDRHRVAVAVGAARLPLQRGDHVDVWATVDPSLAGGELTTRRVATGAVVTSAGSRAVVVAVTGTEVHDVTEAVALATVTLTASPGPA